MDSASSASFVTLTEGQLLPAICPSCLAPGTRPLPLVVQGPTRFEPPESFYCDICAESHQHRTTRNIAWLAALGLLIIAAITAGALAWGTRLLGIQIALAILLGAGLPWAAMGLQLWRRPRLPLTLQGHHSVLVCDNPKFAHILHEHGFSPADRPETSPRRFPNLELVLLLVLALAWLTFVQSLGGTTIRVVVAGKQDAVLLVDSRHHGRIIPSNSEDPRAGAFIRVLGGRRRLELLLANGISLGGETRTLWPGRTYIVGALPSGKCLYWERKKYGSSGKSLLMPLGGPGPVWELREPVDSWFIPLETPSSSHQPAADSEWESSGGIRRAIRLLPCR